MKPLPTRFTFKAVGLSFVPGYPANIHALADGQTVRLVPDPANPHDPNAVRVEHADTGAMLGHAPAAIAARLQPELIAGHRPATGTLTVLRTPGYEDRPGIEIAVGQ